jgi:hypothetical protein
MPPISMPSSPWPQASPDTGDQAAAVKGGVETAAGAVSTAQQPARLEEAAATAGIGAERLSGSAATASATTARIVAEAYSTNTEAREQQQQKQLGGAELAGSGVEGIDLASAASGVRAVAVGSTTQKTSDACGVSSGAEAGEPLVEVHQMLPPGPT